MKKLCIALVKLFGWKYDVPHPHGSRPEIEHAVYIMAPHTSVWDFLLGVTCLWVLKVNYGVFIKKEFFNFFTRRVLLHYGGVPIDRGNRKNHMVEQAVKLYNENERQVIVITPEGTRKPVKRWKRGFYEIATQANVPIVLTYGDYKKKIMGVGPTFYPTGDFDADMVKIKEYYKQFTARHPEKYIKD